MWGPEGWVVASASRHVRKHSISPLVHLPHPPFIPSSTRRRSEWLALSVSFSEVETLYPHLFPAPIGPGFEAKPKQGISAFLEPLPHSSERSWSRYLVPALAYFSGIISVLSLGEPTAYSCLKLSFLQLLLSLLQGLWVLMLLSSGCTWRGTQKITQEAELGHSDPSVVLFFFFPVPPPPCQKNKERRMKRQEINVREPHTGWNFWCF